LLTFAAYDQSLRGTPAMEIRLSDHVWNMQELASRALSFSENRRAA